MDDSSKYLIHADVAVDGVVERSDVVGAIFGQTEGLLGDDLDLRDLQQSSRVGRIDVSISSEGGRSTGEITIASGLDKVETAVFAAALETIEQVGPCSASIRVDSIEDVRAARRRRVIDRATALFSTAFEDDLVDSAELVDAVRERVRVERITDYEGLPAGPHVETGDAIVVVEGRADVLTLLSYGIKNAIAVEGTDVPEAVADLTADRTVTAFLDGDRGGELILRELVQVGSVDSVAFAPTGRSVEDLSRDEVYAALQEKVSVDVALAGLDAEGTEGAVPVGPGEVTDAGPVAAEDDRTDGGTVATAEPRPTRTVAGHVDELRGSDRVRLLDAAASVIDEAPAAEAFDRLVAADEVPVTVVLDGTLEQRLLDVATQRGVARIVARDEGDFTKKPVDVRIRLFGSFDGDAE